MLSRPQRVYKFINNLNEDLLGFLVDIGSEIQAQLSTYDARPKLFDWKQRMARILHDRVAIEFP